MGKPPYIPLNLDPGWFAFMDWAPGEVDMVIRGIITGTVVHSPSVFDFEPQEAPVEGGRIIHREPTDHSHIADEVEYLRVQVLGISRSKLARRLDVSPSAVEAWGRASSGITIHSLTKLRLLAFNHLRRDK